jgi:hypothetical protein
LCHEVPASQPTTFAGGDEISTTGYHLHSGDCVSDLNVFCNIPSHRQAESTRTLVPWVCLLQHLLEAIGFASRLFQLSCIHLSEIIGYERHVVLKTLYSKNCTPDMLIECEVIQKFAGLQDIWDPDRHLATWLLAHPSQEEEIWGRKGAEALEQYIVW